MRKFSLLITVTFLQTMLFTTASLASCQNVTLNNDACIAVAPRELHDFISAERIWHLFSIFRAKSEKRELLINLGDSTFEVFLDISDGECRLSTLYAKVDRIGPIYLEVEFGQLNLSRVDNAYVIPNSKTNMRFRVQDGETISRHFEENVRIEPWLVPLSGSILQQWISEAMPLVDAYSFPYIARSVQFVASDDLSEHAAISLYELIEACRTTKP